MVNILKECDVYFIILKLNVFEIYVLYNVYYILNNYGNVLMKYMYMYIGCMFNYIFNIC